MEIDKLISAINKLTPETKPKWGKMNTNQMVWHCKKFIIFCIFFKRIFLDDKANLFLSLIVLQEIILDLKFFSTYLFTNNNC